MNDTAKPISQLFFDLTPSQLQPVPALHLSEQLVRLIGSEVCTFRRNAQLSYQFVDTALRLIGEIRTLIDEVKTTGKITSFSRWTKALKPLEKTLLEFSPDDFIGSDKLINTSSLGACRQDLESWKKSREKIQQSIQSLADNENLKNLRETPEDPAELKLAYRRDDQAFFEDLVAETKAEIKLLKANQPEFPTKCATSLDQISTQASQIKLYFNKDQEATASSEDLDALVIQSMMAICGWTHFAATLDHLRVEKVYSSAEQLMEGLRGLTGVGDPSTPKKQFDEVNRLYVAFINLVFGKPSFSCIDMMKLLSEIGRAYFAQALALVIICEEAVEHYQKSCSDDPDGSYASTLNKALEKTLEALNTAVTSIKSSNEAAGLQQWKAYELGDQYENHPCSAKFKSTLADLITYMTSLGLSKEAEHRELFQDAVKEDKDHMTQANERMKAAKFDDEQMVDLTVKVHKKERAGASLLDKPYTARIQKSTLISAIEWGISEIPNIKTQLNGMETRFEQEDPNDSTENISKSNNVGQVAGNSGTLTLFMLVEDFAKA